MISSKTKFLIGGKYVTKRNNRNFFKTIDIKEHKTPYYTEGGYVHKLLIYSTVNYHSVNVAYKI